MKHARYDIATYDGSAMIVHPILDFDDECLGILEAVSNMQQFENCWARNFPRETYVPVYRYTGIRKNRDIRRKIPVDPS